MATVNLTDKKIRSLKTNSKRVEYWDKSLPAFGIRVTATGKKSFCIMYRIGGKQRRMTLGFYPKLKLVDARNMAKDAFELVRKGKDPIQEKKLEEARAVKERLEAKTFSQLAQQYVDEYAKANKRSWKEDKRIITTKLNPEFGALNVKDISRSHVRTFLRQIAVNAPVAANRTLAYMRKIFNWGLEEEVVELEANPCSGISRPGGREKPKERVLSDPELKSLWNALKEEDPAIKHILRLILLTGQRPGEVMGAMLNELDLEQRLWTIPGSRTKNSLASIVPLSLQAVREFEKQKAILENQKQKREKRGDPAPDSKFVFPNRLISKHADSSIVYIRKAVGRLHRNLKIPAFTAHDLRRTCATRLGEMGIPGHVIGRILNHKLTNITSSVYNQYQYIEEKRQALDAWGARVTRIVSKLELIVSQSAEA